MKYKNMTFGQILIELRREKNMQVKWLLIKLKEQGQDLSASYITRIEKYDEIPRPGIICSLSNIFKVDLKILFDAAKKQKISKFVKSLDEKYLVAVAHQNNKAWSHAN